MNSLLYYYNMLYEEDIIRVSDNRTYHEWLDENYLTYDKVKKNNKVVCQILTGLVLAGIPISIIASQSEILFLHASFGTLSMLMSNIIREYKEKKFTNDYFTPKEIILEKLEQDEARRPNIISSNKNYKNNLNYTIKKFEQKIGEYQDKYEIPVFLSKVEYLCLYNYLKNIIDKKIVSNFDNYYDLFFDLLNRTYAKCLYTGKNVEIYDFLEQIVIIDENNARLKEDINIIYNRLNIEINLPKANIYNIEDRKKK